MGSPKGKEGRDDWEGPQHWVELGASLMEVPIVGVCSPWYEDLDCKGGTCQQPEVLVVDGKLRVEPGVLRVMWPDPGSSGGSASSSFPRDTRRMHGFVDLLPLGTPLLECLVVPARVHVPLKNEGFGNAE